MRCLGNFLCSWILLFNIVNGPLSFGNLTSFVSHNIVRRGQISGQGKAMLSALDRKQPPKLIEHRPNTPAPTLTEAPIPPAAYVVIRGIGSYWVVYRSIYGLTARWGSSLSPSSSSTGLGTPASSPLVQAPVEPAAVEALTQPKWVIPFQDQQLLGYFLSLTPPNVLGAMGKDMLEFLTCMERL